MDELGDSLYRQTLIAEVGHFKYFLEDRVHIKFFNGFMLDMTPEQVRFCQVCRSRHLSTMNPIIRLCSPRPILRSTFNVASPIERNRPPLTSSTVEHNLVVMNSKCIRRAVDIVWWTPMLQIHHCCSGLVFMGIEWKTTGLGTSIGSKCPRRIISIETLSESTWDQRVSTSNSVESNSDGSTRILFSWWYQTATSSNGAIYSHSFIIVRLTPCDFLFSLSLSG